VVVVVETINEVGATTFTALLLVFIVSAAEPTGAKTLNVRERATETPLTQPVT
jgi:hypothetical protein